MARKKNEAEVVITADTTKATKQTEQFNKKLGETGKAADKSSKSMGDTAKSLAKYAAVAAIALKAATTLVSTMRDGIKMAVEQETINRKLIVSLSRYGGEVDKNVKGIKQFAAAQQTLSIFSNEQIETSATLLANMGVVPEKLQEATLAAINLARTYDKDLSWASEKVSEAFLGQAGELTKLVPGIENLTTRSLEAGDAATLINERFGGAAQSEMDTYAGKVTALGNAWDDLKKAIGGVADKDQEAKAFLDGWTVAITKMSKAIEAANTAGDKWTKFFEEQRAARVGAPKGFGQPLPAGTGGARLIDPITGEDLGPALPIVPKKGVVGEGVGGDIELFGALGTTKGKRREVERKRQSAEEKRRQLERLRLLDAERRAAEKVTEARRRLAEARGEAAADVRIGGRKIALREADIKRRFALEDLGFDEAIGEMIEEDLIPQMTTLGISAGFALMQGIKAGIEGEKDAFKSTIKGLLPIIGTIIGGIIGGPAGISIGGQVGGGIAGLFHTGSAGYKGQAHTGVGLRSDETFKVLQDEMVLNRQAVQTLGGEGRVLAAQAGIGSGGGNTYIINTLDTQTLRDSLRRGPLGRELVIGVNNRRGQLREAF